MPYNEVQYLECKIILRPNHFTSRKSFFDFARVIRRPAREAGVGFLVDGFLDALRTEVRRENLPISVTNVLPATINTPLFDQARTKIGVKPVAPPPIYQPDIVVEAILYAAEHPVRDLVVGGSAKALILGQKLAPRLVDALTTRFGFEAHDTGQPKAAEAPDNLYAPLDDYDTARNGFDSVALSRSFYTSLQRHPLAKRMTLAGAALGALGFVLRPVIR